MASKRKAIKKVHAKAERAEIAVTPISSKYSSYPSNGLTPRRLASILREADAGDLSRQAELFEEMEEKDPHLYAQLQTRKNAVTGLDFEIIPFDSNDELDKTIAEFVDNEIRAIEDMEDVMLDLLDAIGKGIAVSEILWDNEDGKTIIKDIVSRHQKNFFWDTDDNFKVRTKEHAEGILLPENKFIIHRYKARSGHPARAGVLRVVAWMYLFKNFDIKDWVAFAEIYGMPLRLGKYSQGISEDDKNALNKALIQIGSDAAGMISDTTSIEFIESSKTTSVDVFERLARYCDEQISKAVLGQTLTSDAGGGSYAQSKTHNEVRHDLTVADCKALAATLRKYLIRPLVFFNFGEEKRIPTIRFDCEETGNQKEAVEIYKALVNDIGLKIPTEHIYKKFAIPKPEGDEETAKPLGQASPMFMQSMKAEAPEKNELNKVLDHVVQEQNEIDTIAEDAAKKSSLMISEGMEPVIRQLLETPTLEELKNLLEDDKQIQALVEKMGMEPFEELLQKAMFFSDLKGRVVNDE